jgi:hypothetical protein
VKNFVCGLVAAFACVAAVPASAAYVVDITQVGDDVVTTGSGSINLAALGSPGSGPTNGHLGAYFGYLIVGSGTDQAYSGRITGPSSFGTSVLGGYYVADSATGGTVGFNVQSAPTSTRFIIVPFGYVSGTDLGTSTAIYEDKNFDDLHLVAGTYTWTWGSGDSLDSFTVNVGQVAAVPEPSTWAMMMLGFAGVGFMAYRRRTAALAV